MERVILDAFITDRASENGEAAGLNNTIAEVRVGYEDETVQSFCMAKMMGMLCFFKSARVKMDDQAAAQKMSMDQMRNNMVLAQSQKELIEKAQGDDKEPAKILLALLGAKEADRKQLVENLIGKDVASIRFK